MVVDGHWRTSVERLQRYARALLKDDTIGELVRSVEHSGEPYLFGGAPRDVAFVGARAVGDIDIFVKGAFDPDVVSAMARHSRRTNFGGYRLLIGRHDVDIWELSSSYAFRFQSNSAITVGGLLNSVCFTTDGLAISLLTRKVTVSEHFERAFRDRILDFVCVPTEPSILVSVRAARLLVKLDLAPSDRLRVFLQTEFEKHGRRALITAEERWQGRRVLDDLSFTQLERSLQRRGQVHFLG